MEYKPSFADQLDIDYISHHGVKGMHWGVRRYQNSDGSYTALGKKRRSEGISTSNEKLSRIDKKYDRLAKKDAKEFARAKMSTGEGAGNRRKLIKATVEQRRKENAHYNDVFDSYLDEQDMSKHAKAAKRERAAKDTVQNTRRAVNTTTRVLNTASRFLPYIV